MTQRMKKVNKFIGIGFLATALFIGCNESETEQKDNKKTKTSPQVQQQKSPVQDTAVAPAGQADAYGRMPGEEHYGHEHGPMDQQQQSNQLNTQPQIKPNIQSTPQTGGPDSYGRQPGHEHYGHNHGPLDQQQQQQPQGQVQQPQQQTQTGEDAHGRKPGEEHYGHNHGPLDEKQNQ